MQENKHQPYDLIQMQSLPLDAKIRMTQRRIMEWYEYWQGDVYVSVSGKDSTVLADIVTKLYPDVKKVYVDTGLEFDSVRTHACSIADEILRPQKSFVQIIKEYGYPIISKEVSQCILEARRYNPETGIYQYRIDKLNGEAKDKNGNKSQYNQSKWKFLLDAPFKISHRCCDYMKKKPFKEYEKRENSKVFLGTMASESRLRKSKWLKNGCNAFDTTRPMSAPMSFWTEQDVLEYIKRYDIKIPEAYGDIIEVDGKLVTTKCERTGCVFCMFGITYDEDRFLRLKDLEPKKYDYVMRGGKFDEDGFWTPDKGLGFKFVIDWLNEHGNLNIKY